MMREDVRHQRRATRAARLAIGDQQRALNLMRDFERAGRGWFWETDREGRLVYISPTVAARLDRPPAHLPGHPFTVILPQRVGRGESGGRTMGVRRPSPPPSQALTGQAT